MQFFTHIAKSAVKWTAGVATAIAVIGAASTAGAVTTLSTGDGPLGSAEPNWALTSSPGSTTLTIVSGAQDYPGTWVVAPADSNWITPYAGGGTTATSEAPVGEYDYSLNFANPLASVSIQWSSDNGAGFYLNNVLLSSVGSTGYNSLTSFVISAAAFLPGNNVFEVKVQNDPCNCNNPTGLLVSAIVGPTGSPSATPLPAALPLLASGVGALGLLGWRRKRKAVARS
jgi:hypothetical protein